MGICVPLLFQINHDGTGLFSREDRELGPRMIVPGHGPVSTRIDERRFADGLLIDPLPSWNLHDLIGKTNREVELRIGSLQPVLEVGNQVGRTEIPKAHFGQKLSTV